MEAKAILLLLSLTYMAKAQNLSGLPSSLGGDQQQMLAAYNKMTPEEQAKYAAMYAANVSTTLKPLNTVRTTTITPNAGSVIQSSSSNVALSSNSSVLASGTISNTNVKSSIATSSSTSTKSSGLTSQQQLITAAKLGNTTFQPSIKLTEASNISPPPTSPAAAAGFETGITNKNTDGSNIRAVSSTPMPTIRSESRTPEQATQLANITPLPSTPMNRSESVLMSKLTEASRIPLAQTTLTAKKSDSPNVTPPQTTLPPAKLTEASNVTPPPTTGKPISGPIGQGTSLSGTNVQSAGSLSPTQGFEPRTLPPSLPTDVRPSVDITTIKSNVETSTMKPAGEPISGNPFKNMLDTTLKPSLPLNPLPIGNQAETIRPMEINRPNPIKSLDVTKGNTDFPILPPVANTIITNQPIPKKVDEVVSEPKPATVNTGDESDPGVPEREVLPDNTTDRNNDDAKMEKNDAGSTAMISDSPLNKKPPKRDENKKVTDAVPTKNSNKNNNPNKKNKNNKPEKAGNNKKKDAKSPDRKQGQGSKQSDGNKSNQKKGGSKNGINQSQKQPGKRGDNANKNKNGKSKNLNGTGKGARLAKPEEKNDASNTKKPAMKNA